MRGSRAEPERDGDLAVGARLRRRGWRCTHDVEAGRASSIAPRSRRESRARRCACSSRRNSRSCGAKSTTSSRPPGRSTRAASRIARAAVVEEVQHLMDDDDVERVGRRPRDRRCRPAARCNGAGPRARARARASSSMSSDRSRPSPRSICGAEQFEHAPGAGAEIEQRAERLVGERVADRLLDRFVGDVELADAVPFGGVARGSRPAPRRRARAATADEPVAVAGDDRVVGIEPRDQRAGDARRRRPARPAGRTPRRPRGSARSGRPRPAASDAARCGAGTGAGCAVRSDTVSSASASSARMRSRVSSPAAFRAAFEGLERQMVGLSHGKCPTI